MSRSTLFMLVLITILIISFANGNYSSRRRRQSTSTHVSSSRKPVRLKTCGPALVRMLDMVCTKASQLLKRERTEASSVSTGKRQLLIDDDPFARTVSFTDYTQFNNTLVGDCCLQACTLKTLLKYC